MQQRSKVIAAAAALAVAAGAVVAVTLSNRDDGEPTPTDPGVTEPVVLNPVDPTAGATDPATDPATDATEPALEERHLEASGDGDAEGYLPESVWIEAEHDGHEHELDNHEHAEDTTEQWKPVIEGFATELADVDRDHGTWHAAIAPYLSDRLTEVYADPYTQEAFTPTTLEEVAVVWTGETTGRALVKFENFRMDMYITVGPSLTHPSGWEITSIEAA